MQFRLKRLGYLTTNFPDRFRRTKEYTIGNIETLHSYEKTKGKVYVAFGSMPIIINYCTKL